MKNQLNGTIRNSVTLSEFTKVFKVFESFPFFERWTNSDIEKEYNEDKKNGTIFGYYTDDGICAGILILKEYAPGKHPVQFPDNAKVMYLSDVATLFTYRNRGIGTALVKHAIRHTQVLGYDYIYLRTNEEDSMSYGIAIKCGFKKIYDSIQEVERVRTDGTIKKDARIFLEKKIWK